MNTTLFIVADGAQTLMSFAVALVVIIFVTVIAIARLYKRCPSDRILVIYGKVSGNRSSHCIHGGGSFIIPLIQDYA